MIGQTHFIWLAFWACQIPCVSAGHHLRTLPNELVNRNLNSASGATANSPEILDSTNQPFCVVNALAAFFYLAQSSVEVTGAVQDCPGAFTRYAQRTCAADIFGVLQSFINTGALISGLVTQCTTKSDLEADCTNSIMGLIGSLMESLESILSSMSTCKQVAQPALEDARRLLRTNRSVDVPQEPLDEFVDLSQGGRRLPGVSGLDAGWCFVDTGSSAVYLAQTGVLIDISTEGCLDQTTAENKANCASTVTAIIGAVANSVSYLAAAAQRCGGSVTLGLCVADSASFANAMAGIASAGAAMLNTCAAITAESAANAGRLLRSNRTSAARLSVLEKVAAKHKRLGRNDRASDAAVIFS